MLANPATLFLSTLFLSTLFFVDVVFHASARSRAPVHDQLTGAPWWRLRGPTRWVLLLQLRQLPME